MVLGDVVSPQGVAFGAGDQVQFLRTGNKGWTLVRDRSGDASWLPSFEVQELHTRQGIVDYRISQQNGANPSDGNIGAFLSPNTAQTLAISNRASPPEPLTPNLYGDVTVESAAEPENRQQETLKQFRLNLNSTLGCEGSASMGHTGVVGLALSASPSGEILVAAIKPGSPASR